MLFPSDDGSRYNLHSPTELPKASAFLWNRQMMIQINCRGYAVAQFMQPEPAKYAHAPNLEAKTFMQPEQPYFAHHPGRFFYVKDEETGQLFSAPYEPVRAPLESYLFSVGKSDVTWRIKCDGILLKLTLSLPKDDVAELWSLQVINRSGRQRKLSIYPYFPVGYMSWMNQSGEYRPDLGGIVCSCVTPYQKVDDYFTTIKHLKDKTYLIADREPVSWDARQEAFEGEGGLHNPSGVQREELSCSDARYETPAAVMQYRVELSPDGDTAFKFVFGPALDDAEVASMRRRYLEDQHAFTRAQQEYSAYVNGGDGCLHIETPDEGLDNFVNHWLPRQVFYHGDVNRLSTDPQTRNYLQDNMGMSYIKPEVTRRAILHALSQQEPDGAMPDGILLREDAELKYINQIPHTDHCVWLPVCLKVYLDETHDLTILDESIPFATGDRKASVFEHICLAMRWLLQARDERGLSYIDQGDWCDPMNMVGYKGKGVSGWLSVATAYALNLWADVCQAQDQLALAQEFRRGAKALNAAVNEYLWDGQWFARGITDDGVAFGVDTDREGSLFLNPQSWSILSGAADEQQRQAMIEAIEEQLETPYGVAMFAPAYTAMREDVGRVTQKHPGSAENGSVYNHAAIFYIYSLYTITESDRAFKLLRQMIPGPDMADYRQRGQLPVFIPNYYRGAWRQYPRTAGRSSQLFNTGTVSWFYRCLVEGLFGLQGDGEGLRIKPQLPSTWPGAKVTRAFRGASFRIEITRDAQVDSVQVSVNGERLPDNRIDTVEPGRTYRVQVRLPESG